MSSSTHSTRRTALAATAALLSGLGAAALVPTPAEALPSPQRACTHGVLSNTAANGWQPVAGSVVSVNNGNVARNVVVNFNADAGVVPNAEIRLGYRVDGGPIQTPGAQNFANHTEYWQTRHSMVVLTVPAGVHRIQPYWRISGAAGKNGVISSRCLTAEAYTA